MEGYGCLWTVEEEAFEEKLYSAGDAITSMFIHWLCKKGKVWVDQFEKGLIQGLRHKMHLLHECVREGSCKKQGGCGMTWWKRGVS